MKIAILGAGNVGQALGLAWIAKGYDVRFGVRHPESPKYASLPAGRVAGVGAAPRGAPASWQSMDGHLPSGGLFCTDRSSKKEQASTLAPQPRRPSMDKRAEIDRFVRQHNIEHYRKLLGEPTDPLRRQQLQMLLAELEPTQQ
jgi:hypothetical protein